MDVRTQTLSAGLVLGLIMGCALAGAQVTRDPLTPQEADQVRNTAGQLDKRVPLLLSFAAERLQHFEAVRTGPASAPGRASQLYALLQQYVAILPEFNDAVDDLASSGQGPKAPDQPHYNVPKVLVKVIPIQQQLLATLQHIQTTSSATDLATYHFELQTCIDATQDSLQDAQQDLADANKGGGQR